jgi:hypothetical protein
MRNILKIKEEIKRVENMIIDICITEEMTELNIKLLQELKNSRATKLEEIEKIQNDDHDCHAGPEDGCQGCHLIGNEI